MRIRSIKNYFGIEETSFGFEGMTSNKKEAFDIFGEEVIYDRVTLKDILLFYTRGNE